MKAEKFDDKHTPKRLMVQTHIRAGATHEEMWAKWQEAMKKMDEKMAEAQNAFQESLSTNS